MTIIVEIFPTISNITKKKKKKPKNTYVKTYQRQKDLRIKRFRTYKLQKQSKKICDYCYKFNQKLKFDRSKSTHN